MGHDLTFFGLSYHPTIKDLMQIYTKKFSSDLQLECFYYEEDYLHLHPKDYQKFASLKSDKL